MDILSTLIKTRQAGDDIPALTETVIDEILKYQKLSKSPKFQHITKSPVLQKQLPEIWKAFNEEPINMHVFEQAINIVQQIYPEQLTVFVDYVEHYDKKHHKQLSIIGSAINYPFSYHELTSLAYVADTSNTTTLINDDGNMREVCVIVWYKNSAGVYSGTLKPDTIVSEYKHAVQPIEFDGVYVALSTFSSNGNNDYAFATIVDDGQNFFVSMPSTNELLFYSYDRHMFTVELSDDESNTLNMQPGQHEICKIIYQSYTRGLSNVDQ